MNPVPHMKRCIERALEAWISKNHNELGRWAPKLEAELRKFRKKRPTAINVAAFAMYLFQLLASFGVVRSFGEDCISIAGYGGLDRETTNALVSAIEPALRLLSIPYSVVRELGWD